MSEQTDVYVRIKYKKNGKIYEDDLLEDIDMYDALSDMEYNGIYYEIDDKLIMRAYGRNYYALCFQNESELKDYLFEISKEKGIENIYYIYCEYSYIMEVIRYGVINIDIVNVNIEKEEKYIEIFEKIARKSYPKLLENYEKYIDDELEEEEVEEYEDKMDEIMGKYSLKEFEKFLDKVKLK